MAVGLIWFGIRVVRIVTVVLGRSEYRHGGFGVSQAAGKGDRIRLALTRFVSARSQESVRSFPFRCSRMSIEISCPGCARLLRVAAEHAGKQTRCPACDNVFTIPLTESAEGFATQTTDNPFATSVAPAMGAGSAAAGDYEQPLPHRGVLVLVMGLLSWFICGVFGVAAWYLGQQDLKRIRAGIMDRSGFEMTRAGYWLGLASVLLHLAVIGLMFLLVVIAVVAEA